MLKGMVKEDEKRVIESVSESVGEPVSRLANDFQFISFIVLSRRACNELARASPDVRTCSQAQRTCCVRDMFVGNPTKLAGDNSSQ